MGPLAQLVAHLHDAQGVTGSSPVRPTSKHPVQWLPFDLRFTWSTSNIGAGGYAGGYALQRRERPES